MAAHATLEDGCVTVDELVAGCRCCLGQEVGLDEPTWERGHEHEAVEAPIQNVPDAPQTN
jgi:hypothetical protein